jgi:hypothetical protein
MEARIGVGFTDRHPADFVDGIDEAAVSRDAVDLRTVKPFANEERFVESLDQNNCALFVNLLSC